MRLHIMFTHGQHAVVLEGAEADLLLAELDKPNPRRVLRLREWVIAVEQICHVHIDPE